MRNTNRTPAGNFAASFQELIARKKQRSPHKPVLQALFTTIERRFAEFQTTAPRLEDVNVVDRSADECAALSACYKGNTRFKRDLRCALGLDDDTLPVQFCPYCQLAPVGVWDHFLPSSIYPDFFTHPLNLVRACPGCNEIKGDKRVAPRRETLHPYFDQLHVQYLRCQVSYDTDFHIEFVIRPNDLAPGYCAYTHQVVDAHFRTYGLARRFRAEASRKVNDFRANMAKIAESRPITAADLDREIRYETSKAIRSGEGPNSWILAFWDGLASCPNLATLLNDDSAILSAVVDAAPELTGA